MLRARMVHSGITSVVKMLTFFSVTSIFLSVYSEAIHLRESAEMQYPSCYFNPLCTCSKEFPDLGKVVCKDVPLYRIPTRINASKVYILHMENNGLRSLEPYFFQNTGLHSIEISRNLLTEIPPDTFAGLHRSLWELYMQHNYLRQVPNRALRYLHKLKLLDLTDNEIAFVSSEDWRGLEESLEILVLRENGIIALQPSSFAPLKNLEVLDLSGNALFEIDGNVFKDGPFQMTTLNLANNILSKIPYQQLSYLKLLRHLDLSFNRIAEMHDSLPNSDGSKGISLALDTLRLDYNQIHSLPEVSFKYLPTLDRIYFNGNPISKIYDNAFRGSRVQHLFMRDCALSYLESTAFAGLEATLRILDLAGNNVTILPRGVFEEFNLLETLYVEENPVVGSDWAWLQTLDDTLHELRLGGFLNFPLSLSSLGKLKSIRSLTVFNINEVEISQDDFHEFGIDIEELAMSFSNIMIVKNHAFAHVRRLKKLDLSENSISFIERDAFAEIGHFLQHLIMANGLSPTLSVFPADALRHLTALQHLDISNNGLKYIEKSSFHSMKKLQILHLQDNRLESLPQGMFTGEVHNILRVIHLSFNRLTVLSSDTFSDLDALEIVHLNDNEIKKIERRAFTNLDKLKYLGLRGNKIDLISSEAFENLPQLEVLDLAYNKLNEFNYSWLDQVGILSSLCLNASHNSIDQLSANKSITVSGVGHEIFHVNIKVMDFSHNNISRIGRSYFKEIESSVTHLYLSHNVLKNVTEDSLGNMTHLQWLDLSYNQIEYLAYNILTSMKRLQVLKLSRNRLTDVPKDIFRNLENLRVIELADNSLKSLPDLAFKYGTVERLDLSGNQLIRVPVSSFQGDTSSALLELDLSDNFIMSLHSVDIFHRFPNLQWLDLSSNPLIRIENGVFSYVTQLHGLDLSHNTDIVLDLKGRTFLGLDHTLEELFLRNLSLNEVPELHLPYLKTLDLSDNEISTVPAELAQNLPSLRRLELVGNRLSSVPLVINSLTHLEYLGLSDNPIDSVTFHRGLRLKELDIRNLPLTNIESDVLDHLQYLQTLRMSLPRKTSGFNLPRLLKDNPAVRHLYLECLDDEQSLDNEMDGSFPSKMSSITLSGRGFHSIGKDALKGFANANLNLAIFNTSIREIGEAVFENARSVRNVSMNMRQNRLRVLANPNTGLRPNVPKKSFLLGLKVEDNDWLCNCDIGWIEGWDRSRRQYLCEDDATDCYGADDDLRTAVCGDKSRSVLDALKTDIECGWSSTSSPRFSFYLLIFILLRFRFI